ncbi:MAG TPA: ChrR family anti-sigma-E factor [Xanthobacteraceae bacterium]|jgi:putative transcriptional regulator|nr:ChrR family anti-sigma-E factor [Xanthobacteraceae bacterium]
MTIIHHPSDATLAAFASGTLDEARGIVVAAHLSLCAQCRGAVQAFEEVGGVLLGDVEPAAMSAGALQRAMAALGPLDIVAPAIRGAGAASDLPAPLSHYAVGRWRWIGRGVQWRPVEVASHEGVRVFMLKAAPGTKLPRHRHTGTEWTCVFDGAFSHALGRYGAGDFDEADESVEHDPVVDAAHGCVCLVALQGHIELQGWLGRLIQPFVRI